MADRRRSWRRSYSLAALAVLGLVAGACSGAGGGGGGGGSKTVTVVMVEKLFMQDIEKLSSEYKKDHPDSNVKFVTLPENELRDRVTQDIATQAGQYDVVQIGTDEVPIWAKNGWLTKLDDDANKGDYDVNDLIPPVRQALTYNDGLYAVPFYGESSFLMYRKDLFQQAGLTMPAKPTWRQVVRRAVERPPHRSGDQAGGPVLRRPGAQVRRAGRAERGLLRVPDRDGPGQRRDVVRRDGRRRLAGGPGDQQGRGQDGLRAGAGGEDAELGLAVGLGAGHPEHVQEQGRGVGLRVLGDLQGLPEAGRPEARVGQGAA